jgi:hypothetical protein
MVAFYILFAGPTVRDLWIAPTVPLELHTTAAPPQTPQSHFSSDVALHQF